MEPNSVAAAAAAAVAVGRPVDRAQQTGCSPSANEVTLSVPRAVMRAFAEVAARAAASAKMVMTASKAVAIQPAFASSGGIVWEVVAAAAPHDSLDFNASSNEEEDGVWVGYVKNDGIDGKVDRESSTFSPGGQERCVRAWVCFR